MTSAKNPAPTTGNAGELHQTTAAPSLTTNQGIPIADNQSSLRAGPRGPTLLEDFILREKITHFDHERIPERIVHARGSGAHGYFEVTASMSAYTKADFLQTVGARTPVFVRFSTVAGGAGSVDTPRDVRGFATKFYTQEGNFDLVGNNIPVFFIQDAIKFPDLVHSVKMEPDRAFPQAGSAHDTFWDFVSLTPESTHMLMWAMSDRGIPRSLRFIEGFGVHTFRLINAAGAVHLVKFHWRPRLGLQSVVWDESLKLQAADNDYHRRDLWNAIASGNFPEWDLYFQIFTEDQASTFDFDVLDPTKLVPEELVPLTHVGRMVLDKNPDNFFAETEQVAFCPANIVPGLDFSSDPLLQGRLFSYLDTQLSRLGGPNFHQIPVNAPKCPMANFQRDGHMQMSVPKGRVAYEPNSLDGGAPRECPTRGFTSAARTEIGPTVRVRSPTFADHYSQAHLFWISQTEPEKNHIVASFVFELSKVETPAIRARMLANLGNVDATLAERVARGLGLDAAPAPAKAAMPVIAMPPSPALSILGKTKPTLEGRVVGVLVTEGADAKLIAALKTAVEKAKAKVEIIAPRIGGVTLDDGTQLPADHQLAGGPSVLFDAVVVAASAVEAQALANEAAALGWIADAFAHLKIIGYAKAALPLLEAAGVGPAKHDVGVRALTAADAADFVDEARQLRLWSREPKVRTAY